jgi:hypothetical protein
MTEQHYTEPDAEAAARAAQLAAMSVTVVEAIARLRAQRTVERTETDERAAAAARAQRLGDHAAARVTWTPAHDEDWLRRASIQDLGRVWAAATPWAATDHDAAEAAQRVEQRLHVLHPEAMQVYHHARATGAHPSAAMTEAAPYFAQPLALETGPRSGTEPPLISVTEDPRAPRVVAADAFPIPTGDAVASRTADAPVLITTAPPRRPTAERANAARR